MWYLYVGLFLAIVSTIIALVVISMYVRQNESPTISLEDLFFNTILFIMGALFIFVGWAFILGFGILFGIVWLILGRPKIDWDL